MRHDERLLVAEHNPNRTKRCGVHQLLDLIGDHGDEVSRRSWRRQVGNSEDRMKICVRATRFASMREEQNQSRDIVHGGFNFLGGDVTL